MTHQEGKQMPQLLIGDEKGFEQVAVNLIQNAIKNSRHHGRVKVLYSYDIQEDMIIFIVSDNGQGMNEKKI
tara:strand:- start:154 stop:366 length:213 start_codon:yes stop_codon:yes gene_type:complete